MNTVNLSEIYNALPEPIIVIDKTYHIYTLNQATQNFSKNNFQNSNLCYKFLYNREEPCPYCPLQTLSKNPTLSLENIFPKNGLEVIILHKREEQNETFLLNFLPLFTEEKKFLLIEIIKNITKQKEKENEDLRIRNLASLGVMVSGVAHELNNPLTGINLTLQNLKKELTTIQNPKIWEKINSIENDLNRTSYIVTEIINFAKPKKTNKSFCDIRETIDRAKESIEKAYPKLCESIEWEIIQETENTNFYFDQMKMERLFINLFRNSIQAIDYKKGKIIIEIKKKKGKLQITVEDNGGGIEPEIIEKIFDPFFSGRSDGGGTGLGLSIAHSVVVEHGGKISAKSYNDKTKFIIVFPLDN